MCLFKKKNKRNINKDKNNIQFFISYKIECY